jgi:hypothetical protein
MNMYFTCQDKHAPFGTLSLVNVQTVGAGGVARAGSYYGLVSHSHSGYASRTLMPDCLEESRLTASFGFTDRDDSTIQPIPKRQRTGRVIPPAACVVKARIGQSTKDGPSDSALAGLNGCQHPAQPLTPTLRPALLGASARPRRPRDHTGSKEI